jgi:DNA polymerase
MPSDRDKAARELLAFYLEAGVDALVGETPADRLADETRPPRSSSASPAGQVDRPKVGREEGECTEVRPMTPSATLPRREGAGYAARPGGNPPAPSAAAPPSPDAAIMAAREAAAKAQSLDDLRALLDRFEGCALRATATQLVFADGNPDARVMFVGEAPGRDEDIAGRPFVGRSGQLLDRMMAAIGLDRTSAYIANIVPWRPPGNRTPTPQESAICMPFLLRQIELADPDFLVCLGAPSMQTLLAVKGGITQNRGRWLKFHTGTREVRAMATFHPAFLLRSPLQKRLAWRDFLAIKKALGG